MHTEAPRPSPGRPRIAVVGGGIGGLAAAAFLRRAGVMATVYEQAPRSRRSARESWCHPMPSGCCGSWV